MDDKYGRKPGGVPTLENASENQSGTLFYRHPESALAVLPSLVVILSPAVIHSPAAIHSLAAILFSRLAVWCFRRKAVAEAYFSCGVEF